MSSLKEIFRLFRSITCVQGLLFLAPYMKLLTLEAPLTSDRLKVAYVDLAVRARGSKMASLAGIQSSSAKLTLAGHGSDQYASEKWHVLMYHV